MKAERIVVYPYKMASESSELLADALDTFRVYPDRKYVPRPGDVIVNWGNGHRPIWANHIDGKVKLLNHWDKICLSVNKIDSFTLFKKHGVQTPRWTRSAEVANEWLEDGHWVCCRQEVEGMDGSGLVLAKTPKELVPAKLYTRFIPQEKEFRVYIFDGKMIDVLEKRRDAEALKAGKVDENIRTETNNWVFCRTGVHPPKDCEQVASEAIKALGLTFGGVDVIQSKKDGKTYVLETNTAPGIGGTTVTRFVEAIKKHAANW